MVLPLGNFSYSVAIEMINSYNAYTKCKASKLQEALQLIEKQKLSPYSFDYKYNNYAFSIVIQNFLLIFNHI